MIKLCKGNILDSKTEIITITVNCYGAMGKGLALEAKKKYPKLFEHYKKLCDTKQIKPGKPILVKSDGQRFLLFPTKDHWRYPSKIEWINEGLRRIKNNIDKFDSISLPPLGCGNGGLDFYDVLDLMIKHLEGVPVDIKIYVPV